MTTSKIVHRYPLAYLITFSCTGTRLHGDLQGSVDSDHNIFDSPLVVRNRDRRRWEKAQMSCPAYTLDEAPRQNVLTSIRDVCDYRKWRLIASHVRHTHVHNIVDADDKPERVMNDFKAYASRRLNKLEDIRKKRWSRHGSTVYLWTKERLEAAISYVVFEQGEPLALYWNNDWT